MTKIFTVDFTLVVNVKHMVKIFSILLVFLENMNFNNLPRRTSGDEGWCLNMANRLSARLIEVAAPASELS